jgi:hypothetical protein
VQGAYISENLLERCIRLEKNWHNSKSIEND